MTMKEFFYKSKDGVTDIHAVLWLPDGDVRAVLQISHGMIEHIERYEAFAGYLTEKGYLVVGNDHLGHGKSVQSEENLGYFCQKKANRCVVEDLHQLRLIVQKAYPDVPYFMLGHSMGSFLLREYLTVEGSGLSGALILGTGYQSRTTLNVGQLMISLASAVQGWRHRSRLVLDTMLWLYDRRFEGDTLREWLTSDMDEMMEIYTDPLCNFLFTYNGYYFLLGGMKELTLKKRLAAMDKDVPILLASGEDDPVGDYGSGVIKVYQQFVDAGVKQVDIRLYPGDRHEILHEADKDKVYDDLYHWMEQKI